MEMMDMAADDTREELRRKLRSNFDGRIVRKDLTKKIKEGANVPVYVLEFLLGQYCSSDDETIIEQGVQNVKRILADNFVRPDEAQKILSQLRKNGSHTIIDMVTVHLDIKKDCFFAEFSNLGLTNVPITDDYPEKYDRLLCGGIWCIVQLEYESEGDSSFGITDIDGQPISSKQKKQKDISPISIHKLTPIQMPHIDIEEVREGRKAFTQEEWMDVMLRSCGYEPEQLNNREKWLLLARMLPLVENNFNLCELGPRSTGKPYITKKFMAAPCIKEQDIQAICQILLPRYKNVQLMQGLTNNKPDFRIQVKGLFGTEEKRFEVVGGDKKRSATKKKSDLGWIDRLEEIDAALDDF